MRKSYTAVWLCLALGAAGAVHAQVDFRPGYLVRPAGDTVRGLVDYRGGRRSALVCQFKPEAGAPTAVFAPQQLRGYGVWGQLAYRTCLVPQPDSAGRARPARPLFLELLADGPAALYQGRDSNDETHFYLQKDGASLVTELRIDRQELVEGGRQYIREIPLFRGVLNQQFADCPSVLLSLAKTELKATSLVAAVQRYNSCRQPAAAPRAIARPQPARVGLEVLAGGMGSRIQFAGDFNFANGDFRAALAPSFGLAVQGSTRTLSEKLALRLEIHYAQQQYAAEYKYKPAPSASPFASDDSYQARFTTGYLRVPLLLRYSPFTNGQLRPFIEAGIMYGFAVQLDGEQRRHTYQTTTYGPWEPAFANLATSKTESGFEVGVGTQLLRLAGHPVAILSRLESSGGFLAGTGYKANQLRYSLLLSFNLLKSN